MFYDHPKLKNGHMLVCNESEGTARLIASAPELMEALELVLQECFRTSHPRTKLSNVLNIASEAIRKAQQ